MSSESIFSHRTLCLVTGASRGYGKALSRRLAALFPEGSTLLVLARNLEGLQATKDEILQRSPRINVIPIPVNLEGQTKSSMNKTVRDAMERDGVRVADFDQAVIVHNAGSLGDVTKTVCQLEDAAHLRQYWELNLTAMLLVNNVFFEIFPEELVSQRVVLNVSTAAATTPIKSWSLYCAGKAARDMLFRTMALEEPTIRILNYAPGPIDTDMQLDARQNTADPEIRKLFNDFFDQGKLLSCDQSIDKLIPLLEKNTFDSGAHIDYYDI